MKKRIVAILLALLLCSSLLTAFAAGKATSFSDVPKTYWAYNVIMEMTAKDLFRGTTEPVNGVGTFEPRKAMTRAEFVTVAMRAVYPTEAAKITTTGWPWWQGYYDLALQKNILKASELENGKMDKAMSREEMAMVMVRCVESMGEKLTKRVPTTKIADYSTIGSYYKDFVRDCFSFGLLAGVDKQGTFEPKDTLERAEAATALLRLIDKSKRETVDFSTGSGSSGGSSGGSTGSGNTGSGSGSQTPVTPPASDKMTYEEYNAMTGEQQQAFMESFDSVADFFAWYNKVKAEYEANQDRIEIGSGGSIDLGDLIKP